MCVVKKLYIIRYHLDSLVLHPGLLGGISDAIPTRKIETGMGAGRNEMHFAEQSHQERRLARSCGTDYKVDVVVFKEEFILNAERILSS